MFRVIFFTMLLILLAPGWVAAAGITEVIMSAERSAPGVNPVLIGFNCDDQLVVKFQVYYASPFNPDTWVPYKAAFDWWGIINEPGSPHHYTVNIKYIHPRWIGLIRIAVSSIDSEGRESELVEGEWGSFAEAPDISRL